MLTMAVATSIDALAVGISLAMAGDVHIVWAVLLIGCITFIMCVVGVKLGNLFGSRYEKKAQIAGGVILILLGTKILLEHLGILP
jgi:putative Mn2+ efflux pump MntP